MPNAKQDSSELTNSVALLVIDAQDAFISSLTESDSFLQRCAFAIDAARALGILTLFSEQVPDKLGHTNTGLIQRAANPKVFHKTSFSALSAPGIEGFLRDNEIYHVLVCGLETPICVYQTALQAVDEDIDVTFLADALGCRRIEDARIALDAIKGLGCQVLPAETVFYSLLGGADHPQFKAFTNLVKTFSDPQFSIKDYLQNPPKIDKPKEDKEQPRRNKNRRSRTSRQDRNRSNNTPRTNASDQSAHPVNSDTDSPEKEKRPSRRPSSKRTKENPNKAKSTEEEPKKQPKKSPRKRVARKAPKKSASSRNNAKKEESS